MKVYRIREVSTGKYLTLGYKRRSSWNVFPGAIIKEYPYIKNDIGSYMVDVFELTKTEELYPNKAPVLKNKNVTS